MSGEEEKRQTNDAIEFNEECQMDYRGHFAALSTGYCNDNAHRNRVANGMFLSFWGGEFLSL